MTDREILDEILKRLDNIEERLSFQENPHNNTLPYQPTYNQVSKCNVCGVEWKGVMSYYCANQKCPMQITITSNVSYSNIEDLDPSKRSWVYDGYGIPRKRESYEE
jgi:hypothetical protein